MNDEPFFDLAMKVIAGQGTDAERAELDTLLAREPKLRAEFERMQADVRMAKDAMPLVDATQAATGELPAYARGRLQTKVRQTLGRPAEEKEPDRSLAAGWRWLLGVAMATAVVLLVVLPIFRTPNAPVIQLAMLDTTGGTRGSDTNEVQLLRQSWNVATMDSFSEFQLLHAWETNWPTGKQPAFKIIYDRAAAEMRVLERRQGKTIEKTFLIEQDLASALKQARIYVQSETKR